MIRRANKQDGFTIFSLQEKAFDNEKWDFESIKRDLEEDNKFYYVIEEDNKVIGFVSYLVVKEQADLLQIVIEDNYRAQGYGKSLLRHTMNDLKRRKVEKIFLEVRVSNKAIHFYEKMGFLQLSRRKNYYNDEDGLVYVLSL